jgi:hypothetical protein
MGYMGFGMRKEVYNRKPRKPFAKLKKLYDQELRKSGTIKNSENRRFSKTEIQEVKERIRRRIRKEKQKDVFLTILSFVILIVLVWYLFFK